jgi:hypothetical protein
MPCRLQVGTVAAAVANDIEAAKALYASDDATWSAESLALYTQAVLQGAFVLAKAKGGPRSRATASRTSAAISSNCSVDPLARSSDDHQRTTSTRGASSGAIRCAPKDPGCRMLCQ